MLIRTLLQILKKNLNIFLNIANKINLKYQFNYNENGKREGISRMYHTNGLIESIGTLLNGEDLDLDKVYELHDGDVIKIGSTTFKFKSSL